jgi:acetoacetyl-CoA synthetase
MSIQAAHIERRLPLFEPSSDQKCLSQVNGFIDYCERRTYSSFADYASFERFAIERYSEFWSLLIQWSQILCDGPLEPAVTSAQCEKALFFTECRLNYVENLLRTDSDRFEASRPALTAVHADRPTERWSRGELRSRVDALATGLTELGLRPGCRVAIIAANTAGSVLGCLAAAAVGCPVSTGAPEMGTFALNSRLARTEPMLLMVDLPEGSTGVGRRQRENLRELVQGLPSLRGLLLLDDGPVPEGIAIPIHRASQMLEEHRGASLAWPRLPFNHPLFILFTSGTTGAPKCLVHGAGGTLIEHLKEHRLHCDLRGTDKLFFQTSTGWMMWNWQLSALGSGVELVLYDGPVTSADQLWRIVAQQQVSVFGTSPAYLQICERSGWRPDRDLSFESLRAVLSTGSILYPRQQEWLWNTVKQIPIQSISGGTDIVGCFVLGSPLLPVYAGECQCRSLALDVRAVPPADSEPLQPIGELVCANPFPSRPLAFLDDPDGARFHAAYFKQHPGVWTHGDLIEFTLEGTARMHGRSDGVLNIRGIRIGPAEIYRILESLPEISESMAVEQSSADEVPGSRLILLVVLRQGDRLDDQLIIRIKRELGHRGSAAHVPSVILAVDELPTTHSGKRSERSARDALNGRALVNGEALRNAWCLEPLRAYASRGPRMPPEMEQQQVADASDESTQQIVTRSWERALGLSPIEPHDNFFDLGGESIAALRICAELQSRIGREIAVTLLYKAPTIATMTAALEGRLSLPYEPLWLMRREEGTPPLYIVHGFGGSTMELVGVVRQLRINRSVYAIQARGFEPGDAPHESVEGMAREYLTRVRELQPHGPYMLAGYSFGGLVAYEMARMLAQAGEQIARLVLLDTTVHERHWPATAWVEFLWRRLRRHARSAWGMPAREWKVFGQHLWRSWMERSTRALLARAQDDSGGTQLPEAVRRVRSAALSAMAAYRPQPSNVGISLIRSDLRVSRGCDPILIWKNLAPLVQVLDVAGDHLTILRPPNLQMLAEQLSRAVAIQAVPETGHCVERGGGLSQLQHGHLGRLVQGARATVLSRGDLARSSPVDSGGPG